MIRKGFLPLWEKEPIPNDIDVADHLGLVGMVVKWMSRSASEREEVESHALCGLYYASRYWDSSLGKFSTYAVGCMTGWVLGWRSREERFRYRKFQRKGKIIRRRLHLFSELGDSYVGGNTDLFARDSDNPVTENERQNVRERITKSLEALTYREREVVKLRFGLFDGPTHTFEEVGKIFQICSARVRQIEQRAIRKLSDNAPYKFGETPRKILESCLEDS